MCIGYVVDSTTRVGTPKNGRQDISVYDANTGTRAIYNSSVENVDKFLNAKVAKRKSLVIGMLGNIPACLGVAFLPVAEKLTKTTKIGAGIALGLLAVASWLPWMSACKQENKVLETIKNDSNANATCTDIKTA